MTHTSTEPRNKLLPCPFCGARARFEIDDERWEWVECSGCGIQGNRSASLMEDCKPKLAEAWNRRAQVVPNGWKLVPEESTEAMARAFRADDAPYYFAMITIRCNDFAERYRAALAAAPQPPEAACNPSMQPELATLAAPVQLPEPAVPFAVFDCHGFYTEKPNAKQAQAFCDHYNKRDADGGGSAPYTVQALYTEHQVRQLLAAHGIGKDKA